MVVERAVAEALISAVNEPQTYKTLRKRINGALELPEFAKLMEVLESDGVIVRARSKRLWLVQLKPDYTDVERLSELIRDAMSRVSKKRSSKKVITEVQSPAKKVSKKQQVEQELQSKGVITARMRRRNKKRELLENEYANLASQIKQAHEENKVYKAGEEQFKRYLNGIVYAEQINVIPVNENDALIKFKTTGAVAIYDGKENSVSFVTSIGRVQKYVLETVKNVAELKTFIEKHSKKASVRAA